MYHFGSESLLFIERVLVCARDTDSVLGSGY